ncbi:MAG: class I SAM-dependent methyltransferase [Candidatus Roizmanbacteria bacterium]|nr:class I SAM-dependent methyltransferase [Candidatus Roizmanbacteria bacterium]
MRESRSSPIETPFEDGNALSGFGKNCWEDVWQRVTLPQDRDRKRFHELHAVFSRYLPSGRITFIEVGCAPGSWMSYFALNFGYIVSGLEYAEAAYEKTIENLRLLSIPAQVHLADFFEFEGDTYDVVFSYGFVEHFKDIDRVISRLSALCRPGGYIVTVIPSLEGLNWWISRHFRPEVAAGHYPITGAELKILHERNSMITLWSGLYGCYQIRPPLDNTRLARRYPFISKILNAPFRAWNRVVSSVTRRIGLYPRSKIVYLGTVYIGRKQN